VFAFLVDSYGTVAIFVYMLIACAELRLRRRLEREAPERLRVRMWAYPTLTIVAILTMCAIVAAMAFIPDQRWPLVFGIVSALVMLCGYAISRAHGSFGRPWATAPRYSTCSPCSEMSRPSRSCSSVTRRPIVQSMSFRIMVLTANP
jgi:GABA permease